jgi:hypothetical protein
MGNNPMNEINSKEQSTTDTHTLAHRLGMKLRAGYRAAAVMFARVTAPTAPIPSAVPPAEPDEHRTKPS